jgi:uncharacterized HAD superfamily protein
LIALDIDGVVADSITLLRSIIRYSYGIEINDHISSYQIPEIFPLLNMGAFFEDCLLTFSHAVEPYPDAKEACQLLLEKNSFPLIFLTARRQSLKELTKEWINQKLELPKDSFSVIMKSSFDKQNYIKNSGIEYFVEDRFRTANQIAEIDFVKKSYLINRKWNMGREAHYKVCRKYNLLSCVKDYLDVGRIK